MSIHVKYPKTKVILESYLSRKTATRLDLVPTDKNRSTGFWCRPDSS